MAVRWGHAKIEFIPLMPDIKKLAESGYCKLYIFEKLQNENKITMSKRTFYEYMTSRMGIHRQKNNGKTDSIATPTSSLPPAVVNSAPALMPKQSHAVQVQQAEDDEEFGKKKFSEEDLF